MKNKIIQTITSALIGIGCFIGGTYYATEKFDGGLNRVMDEYEVISDKVDAFTEVSNPKTIRLYIKQLNDLLDNMTRLGKIVENGQELDEALIDILNQQQKLNKKLGDMVTLEEYKAYTVQNDFRLGASQNDDDDQYDLIDDLSNDLDKVNHDYMKKIEKLEANLLDIKNKLRQIEDSKIGKKIFNDG
jgi:hypothetical protein